MNANTLLRSAVWIAAQVRRQEAVLRILARSLLFLSALGAATPPAPQKPKSSNELKAFFQQNCVRCHGQDGSAKDPEGKVLAGRDFTQSAKHFRELSGPASEREIRAYIRTIQRGILFGFTMPSWKEKLSVEDSTSMVRDILLQAEVGKIIQPEADKPL